MFGGMSVFVPLSVFNGFVAYLLWAWTSIFSPNYYLYGFMAEVRYNFIFAGIALFSLLFLGSHRVQIKFSSTEKLLAVFALHASISALLAYSPNPLNLEVYEGLIKALAFCLVAPAFITDRLRLHVLLIALAIGMGFHGLIEGGKFLASGGGHKIAGISSAMISDNNHFAVGLLMVIPLLFFLYQYSARTIVRFGFLATFIITTLAVVGTFSRGGFIGLIVVAVWFILTRRKKFFPLVSVTLISLVLLVAAPHEWFERIHSIRDANEDSSFMGRVYAWKVSTAIAFQNPIFGGGFHSVQNQHVWYAFKEKIDFLSFIPTPAPELIARAAHSIYFEVLGDMGFAGLFLFLAIGANMWRNAQTVKRLAADSASLVWARDLADMLRVSLMVYAISGAAVSMAYFELFYVYAAILAALKRIVAKQIEPTNVTPHADRGSIGERNLVTECAK